MIFKCGALLDACTPWKAFVNTDKSNKSQLRALNNHRGALDTMRQQLTFSQGQGHSLAECISAAINAFGQPDADLDGLLKNAIESFHGGKRAFTAGKIIANEMDRLMDGFLIGLEHEFLKPGVILFRKMWETTKTAAKSAQAKEHMETALGLYAESVFLALESKCAYPTSSPEIEHFIYLSYEGPVPTSDEARARVL